jgi:hypothetical protein
MSYVTTVDVIQKTVTVKTMSKVINRMLHLKNKLIKVTGYRGTSRNRRARVLQVRDLRAQPFARSTGLRIAKGKSPLKRSQYLITVHDLDKNEFRSYYHEYLKWEPLKQSFFGKMFGALARWWEEN